MIPAAAILCLLAQGDPRPWGVSYQSFRARFHEARGASGWLADAIPMLPPPRPHGAGFDLKLIPPKGVKMNLSASMETDFKSRPVRLRLFTRNIGGESWGEVDLLDTTACAITALGGAPSVKKAEGMLSRLGLAGRGKPSGEILIPGYRVFIPDHLDPWERRAVVIEAR